jgi:hypothetical protein
VCVNGGHVHLGGRRSIFTCTTGVVHVTASWCCAVELDDEFSVVGARRVAVAVAMLEL